jgi:Disulphide bond corrector protein DsbC
MDNHYSNAQKLKNKMKKILIIIAVLISSISYAQKAKVTWKFTSKKITADKYELHLTATIPTGWHLYSQFTGEGPVATAFKFNANALVTLDGKVKETGKLIVMEDKAFKSKQKYFAKTVDFIQIVKLKAKIKTNVSGEVEFMICDDSSCQPPTTQKFNITL